MGGSGRRASQTWGYAAAFNSASLERNGIGAPALRYQFAHVAITQLVSDMQSYSLNDQEMIEMAAFEEFGLL
jgi:hypothetical protein